MSWYITFHVRVAQQATRVKGCGRGRPHHTNRTHYSYCSDSGRGIAGDLFVEAAGSKQARCICEVPGCTASQNVRVVLVHALGGAKGNVWVSVSIRSLH